MMMGDATDHDLFRELMTPDDDEDRNRVRQKMFQCFDEIAVHGFPRLNLPPDADGVDYPNLDDKFRNGLQTVVNSIMESVSSPRYDSNTLFLSYDQEISTSPFLSSSPKRFNCK